jgi:hypothetical protein
VGATSADSPQAVTVQNVGNQPLQAVAPGLSVSANFQQAAGAGTPADCSGGFALAPGASCNLSLSFTPAAAGALTGAALLTDNALNGSPATQSIALAGTGHTVATSVTLSASPNPAALNEQVVLTATVFGSPVPTGTITFSSSGTVLGANTLNSSGVATLTTTALPLGTDNLIASYGGNVAYSSSTSNPLSETIVASLGPPAVVSLSPISGTGLTKTFTAVYSDPNGTADLSDVRILFNTAVSGLNACYVLYYPASNALYLKNDANTITAGPLTPGSSSSLSNSQCTLAGAGTSVSLSGNKITANFALTFTSSFSGLKNVYLGANSATVSSGWLQMGTWAPISGGPPTVVSLSPISGTGATQTFTGVYSDPNGTGDLGDVRMLFNTAVTGVNACYVLYYPASNSLYLENNANNGTTGPLTPGSSSFLSNSQCTLAGAGTSVSTSGNNMTVHFALTFTSSFSGLKNVYLGVNSASASSGWVQMGSWVPVSAGSPTVVSLSPSAGTGSTKSFSAVYSDPNGTGDLANVRILFNTAITGVSACYVSYYPASNTLYLENNANNGTAGPLTPGSSSSISNSQCTLAGAGTSVSLSGNKITVNFALTFSGSFSGLKNVYLGANSATASSGWLQMGTWAPISGGPPTVVSLLPTSGTGATQAFTAVYSDPNGTGDLGDVRILFNTSITGVNACYVLYYPASNSVYLENNANNGTTGPLTPGSSSSISNGQCTLAGAGTSVSLSGNNMTAHFALTFTSSFSGLKNVYLGVNSASASSGWVQMGSWAPVSAGPPTVVSLSSTTVTGSAQTFTAVYSDPNGTADLGNVRMLLNTALNGANACYVFYYPASNSLYLENDANTGTAGPLTPGSLSSISNSQCTLAGTGTSVSTSGNNIKVNFALTFTSSFSGLQNAYLSANSPSASSGWVETTISQASKTNTSGMFTDVVIYGASPSGIVAAVEAAKLGKRVILLEPTQHVGGMMSNGLGATDTYGVVFGGLPIQFFENVNSYYGGAANQASYYLEPHVAEQVFNSMLSQQSKITVVLGASLSSVQMTGAIITSLIANNGVTYVGQEYIDASYTGDLLAAANVSFTVGRESSAQYGESLGGVGAPVQAGSTPIDPYVVPGNSNSGLIAHVFPNALGSPGTADSAVMAYNYRLCISSDPNNQIPFSVPANYDPAEFELLGRLASSANPPMNLSDFFYMVPLPNNKFDLNNTGQMSTDEVEESFGYPNGGLSVRQQIEAEQKRYMQALLYFVETDSRIPATVRSSLQSLGFCKDEFTDNGGWPHEIYVREARRMLGSYVMTESDLQPNKTIPDSIGLGGFNVDNHYEHVVNVNGSVYWENNGGVLLGPYQIPYRILTPQSSQATNLLVSVDVSASHVAYDSLRVEVTYMIMGQAAGAAASLAIDENTPVQNVSYSALSTQLVSDGALLTTPVAVISLSPTSGTGAAQTFTGVYFDPKGTGDLATVRMVFNATLAGANACYVLYYPATNALYLENDAYTAFIGPLTPGSSSSISNSQCTLAGTGTSVSTSGNNMTVHFAVTFAGGFSGLQNVYLAATTASASSGWETEGTWIP